MIEIKVYKNNFDKKSGMKKIIIDETKLVFRNGYALAEAEVLATNIEMGYGTYTSGVKSYQCMGVINENYEEAFNISYGDAATYLMFLETNKTIIRYGNNDFIVYSKYDNESSSKVAHIRIVKDRPIIMNKQLYPCLPTKESNIVIASNALYDISKAKFVSTSFEQICEDEELPGIYTIVDRIQTELKCKYKLRDYLIAKINSRCEIVCPVRSLNDGIVIDSYNNYETVRDKYIEKLRQKEEIFNTSDLFLSQANNEETYRLNHKINYPKK